jgi:hypothetical protein
MGSWQQFIPVAVLAAMAAFVLLTLYRPQGR